jgi:hypothetical protein
MKTDIETKVSDIIGGTNLSQSQLDRIAGPQALLFDYLSSHLKKVKERNPLLEKMLADFETNYRTYSDGMKVKLFELLLKKESEDNTPLVNMFSKALEVKAEKGKDKDVDNSQDNKEANNLSQSDMQVAKKILGSVDKLAKGELTDVEFVSIFKKTK